MIWAVDGEMVFSILVFLMEHTANFLAAVQKFSAKFLWATFADSRR